MRAAFPIRPSCAGEFRWLCGWVTARCEVFVDNEGYVNEIAFLDNYYNCTPRSERRYFAGIGAQLIDVSSSVSGICVLGCGGSGSCSANGSNCTAWCRCSPNSPAVGTVSGFGSCSFNYKIVLGNDTVPPNPNCTYTETAAQALLTANRAECDSIGGVCSGGVVHKENGEWCAEGSCESDACPDGMGEGSFL